MTLIADTTPLADEHVTKASAVLARAFFDDPLFVWVEPDAERRTQVLPWLMGIGTRYGTRFGEVHGTVESLMGAAVWLPPGASIVDPDRLEQAGFVDPEAVLGPAALRRFGAFMEHAEALHLRDMADPHWYLMILGVDPPFQGRGLGGAIMQPVLTRADGDNLPCYLETAKERNVPFYRKHGFDVVHEGTMPDGGPVFWTMKRGCARELSVA
ncbi:MAG TPA: GNAT family N-acetyltransferase [Vicinamibacterales bacterium]|nr:GNAT family N-acetyltransferase [Vicinamibacterales bacterium]